MSYFPLFWVIQTHSEMCNETGGLDGIRDEGLLESALDTPFQTFDGQDLYPGPVKKAARLSFGLVSNHPFIDGNERIAAHLMLAFLEDNEIYLDYSQKELIELFLSLAAGEKSAEDIEDWIFLHQIQSDSISFMLSLYANPSDK